MADLSTLHFAGRHDLTMDDKGRVPVPAAFRKSLLTAGEESVTITLGPERSLRGYGSYGLSRLIDRLESHPNPEARRKMRRKLFSNMAQLTFDSQGRVLIPPRLRAIAGLESEVVFLGIGEYFEIWNRAVWERYEADDDEFLDEHDASMNAVHG